MPGIDMSVTTTPKDGWSGSGDCSVAAIASSASRCLLATGTAA